jgi:S-adenosylmethionine hydrolase
VTYRWVAFLTDYGRRDGFVAMCQGVIVSIAADVRVIDVTHDVPPQNIRHGAAVLAQTVPYLPPAVVVGVVDPGVGAQRRGLAIAAGGSVLIGPDNGLLIWAADALGGVQQAVVLDNNEYLRRGEASTFDGRDVFAPAAAHVALGVALGELGPPASDLVWLPEPRRDVHAGRVVTEVLMIDHFGNVQLAATNADLGAAGLRRERRDLSDARPGRALAVALADRAIEVSHVHTFADVPTGVPVLYIDSAGHAALAVNLGSAAATFGLAAGDQVTIAST